MSYIQLKRLWIVAKMQKGSAQMGKLLSFVTLLFWQRKNRIGWVYVARNKALYWHTWCMTVLSSLKTLTHITISFKVIKIWCLSILKEFIKSANISTFMFGTYAELILFSSKQQKIIKTTNWFEWALFAKIYCLFQCFIWPRPLYYYCIVTKINIVLIKKKGMKKNVWHTQKIYIHVIRRKTICNTSW